MFVHVLFLHSLKQLTGASVQNLWHFLAHEHFDLISPSSRLLAIQLGLDLIVILIKLKELNAAHNVLPIVLQVLRFEVKLTLKFIHKNLLLLPNSD